MTWDERLAECKARIAEPEKPLPETWEAQEALAEVLTTLLNTGVDKIMRDRGLSAELTDIMREQVAWSVGANVRKARKEGQS